MTTKPFDYKKEYKDLYMPKNSPMLIDVPAMNYIMIDGKGDPNNNKEFEHAVEVLYGLSFTIKMSKMKGNQPEGYFEYVVPPLEGLWSINNGTFSLEKRDNWVWTLMIRQPEFVTLDFFNWACSELKHKKPDLNIDGARFEAYNEGSCVQMMHIGPYSTEPTTALIIEDFMKENNLKTRLGDGGKHHEIYLSDPRKAKPDQMKTVLRHPVKK